MDSEGEASASDGLRLTGASNMILDDDVSTDDESFVPDSLRDFLRAADKKLEEDLMFLSATEPDTVPEEEGDIVKLGMQDENYDDGDNSVICNEFEVEMAKAKEKDMARAMEMEQEEKDRKERELLQIHQQNLDVKRQQTEQDESSNAANLVTATEDEQPMNLSSPLLNIVHPSADVSESHLKRIAMEGADSDDSSDEGEGIQPLVAMVEGNATNYHPSPMIDPDVVLNNKTMITESRRSATPSPSRMRVGRKLQMELDAEANRIEIENCKHENNGNNDVAQNEKEIGMMVNASIEVPSKSVETEESIEKLSEDVADVTQARQNTSTNATPSVAAAAAASKAAAVVARTVANTHTSHKDEGPIAMPDNSLVANKASKLSHNLVVTGPVEVGTSQQQNQTQQHRNPVKRSFRSFRARDPPSPPKPKEIITRNFAQDEGNRSVSPLGGVATNEVVSPLASPRLRTTTSYRGATHNYGSGEGGYFEKEAKPQRPSPSKRRTLTRPNHAFDRLSRPTTASNLGRARTARKQPEPQPTKINVHDEQRKARERIRKRMATNGRKTKSNNDAPLTSPLGSFGKENNIPSEKSTKSNGRKERMEKMEKERLAKIKAKIEAKEARLQEKKKMEEIKKNKLRLKIRAATRGGQQQSVEETKRGNRPAVSQTQRMLTNPVSPKFATNQRLSSVGMKAQKTERLSLASQSDMFGKDLRSSAPETEKRNRPTVNRTQPMLTIPVAPKLHTDRRRRSIGKKPQKTERLSLTSQSDMFGNGLRSSTAPNDRAKEAPEPRRLTIPKAPNFSTAQRFGDKTKTSSFASPTKKPRESKGDISWSSMLRDMSGIASPTSKAASSVKTGTLTIPITPQFQPIRKRPLPKSSVEKDLEEIQQYKEHPLKARLERIKLPSSSRPKKLTSRQLTTPEPFQLSSRGTRSIQSKDDKDAAVKAVPTSDFTTKASSTSSKKVSPKFVASAGIRRSHQKRDDKPKDQENGMFKARPMPNFNSTGTSLANKKLKSPPTRSLTAPVPFNLTHSSTRRKREEKGTDQKNEKSRSIFKARPMPKISAQRKHPVTRTGPKASKEQKDRPKDEPSKKEKSRNSKEFPTGASGILFHRSFTATSRLSRPKILPQPPEEKVKPFRARPLPKFIPNVIITRTPIKNNNGEHEQDDDIDRELDSLLSDEPGKHSPTFKARPMPKFDKVAIAVKNRDPSKIRSPPPKEASPVPSPFKASPAPDNMLDEPSIPVRRRDPKKLRSPEPVKKPNTEPIAPNSPPFRARPVPDSHYDEPSPNVKFQAKDGSRIASPCNDEIHSPIQSPPQIQRAKEESSNVMQDAKARLRDRLSKRRSNATAVKAATPDEDKNKNTRGKTAASDKPFTSPRAFSSLRVKSILHAQAQASAKQERKQVPKITTSTDNTMAMERGFTEDTPRKSNSTVPRSYVQPLRNSSPKANRALFASEDKADIGTAGDPAGQPTMHSRMMESTNGDADGPQTMHSRMTESTIDNAAGLQTLHSRSTMESSEFSLPPLPNTNSDLLSKADTEKERALQREAKLALALGIPDEDESSSILQLAKEVQKAAEDELSFYGSVDTRSHWSHSLASGRAQDMF